MKYLTTLFLLYFAGPTLAAVPINQLTVNQAYCEKDLPLFDCSIRVSRKNKTAQLVTGNLLFKQDFSSDITATFYVLTQDHAIWKHLAQRTMNDSCGFFFGPDAKASGQRKRFFPTIPDGCPVKAGNYTIGPEFVNRYRKDWEDDLKFYIPPMLPEADNWKLMMKLYRDSDPDTLIGQSTIELRLFNEFMSQ